MMNLKGSDSGEKSSSFCIAAVNPQGHKMARFAMRENAEGSVPTRTSSTYTLQTTPMVGEITHTQTHTQKPRKRTK